MRQSPETAAKLYLAGHEQGSFFIEALQGCKGASVFKAFEHALDNGAGRLSWLAIQGFNRWKMKEHVRVFVKALSNRSYDIKAVAIRWLRANGDGSAIESLERVVALEGFQRSDPNAVECAKRAIVAIRGSEI